jgi:preprotein translocase subunit SecG
MYVALIVVHTLMCFAIIGIVLLQAGKGADIGSAFGGAGSQAVFGSMGTPTVLGKITTGVAVLFMLTSFSLALLGGERGSSVIREPAAGPAAPAPAPAGQAPASQPPAGPAPAAPATAPAPAAPPASK